MQAVLKVARKGAPVESFELEIGKALVGREVGDIVLRDPMSSSRHLELHFDGEQLRLLDLKSTNGTFIAGKRVSDVVLAPGDVVEIGDARLTFDGIVGAGGTMVAMPAARAVGPAGTAVAMPRVDDVVKDITGPTKPMPVAPGRATTKPQKKSSSSMSSSMSSSKGPKKPMSVAAKVVIGGGVLLGLLCVWIAFVAVIRGGTGGTMSSGEATVHAVWFRGTPGEKVEGGTSPITVRLKANETPAVSVGVIEEFSGGTGNMWRTATWLAAFNASRAANISLGDHEYLVRAGGHIDGPSAGMLITATMLALLNGVNIDPATTMTGTINPDGSAGPVGGIVQKMQGAKASGKTRFGYPIGTRNHTDMADKRSVDLEEVGRSLGLEVREIADLPAAYEFLTKVPLSRTTPVAEAAMAVDTDTSARIRTKLTMWKGRVDAELVELNAIFKRKNIKDLSALAPVQKHLDDAQRYERSDLPVAAFDEYVQARIALHTVRLSFDIFERFGRRDFAAMQTSVVAAKKASARLDAFATELKASPLRNSVGGQVNLTRAMTTYLQAQVLAAAGDDSYASALQIVADLQKGTVKQSSEALLALAMRLLVPVVAYDGAEIMLDAARDQLDLVGDEGRAVAATDGVFGREASAFGSAAGATLAYFDALQVEPLADKSGVSMDQARAAMSERLYSYKTARFEALIAEHAKGADDQMLRLAAGIDAFLNSALLVNTFYALGGQQQQDGSIVLENRKALSAQLELARTFAREAAARAQSSAGFIPVAARLAYQQAAALREGDDDDKLAALLACWQSAQWSELAARVASP